MKKILILATMAASLSAHAVVIDFESLTVTNGWAQTYSSYSESGFDFVSSGGGFAVWATDNTSGYYPGSTALFNNGGGSNTTMSKTGGGGFDVGSIQLCNAYRDTTAQTILFTGTRADTSQVFNSFTLTDPANMHTFAFTGMTNIVTLDWLQNSPYHQFDNINTAVPEPATLSALAIGGLALLLRKRK